MYVSTSQDMYFQVGLIPYVELHSSNDIAEGGKGVHQIDRCAAGVTYRSCLRKLRSCTTLLPLTTATSS